MVYFGGKMSDKNLEQLINNKCCVKIGKSDSEVLALLTLAYDEYTVKESSVLNAIGGLRKGKMCKMTQEVGSQNRKVQMQMWTACQHWCTQIEDYLWY
jgi:hypothetical protein